MGARGSKHAQIGSGQDGVARKDIWGLFQKFDYRMAHTKHLINVSPLYMR